MESPLANTRRSVGSQGRMGLKGTIDALEQTVASHTEILSKYEQEVSQNSDTTTDLIRGVEQRLRAAIQDVRTEVLQKLSVLSNDIGQVQKQLNVQKGEANILAQQNKDTNRRITEVTEQVQELSIELLGEPTGATKSDFGSTNGGL